MREYWPNIIQENCANRLRKFIRFLIQEDEQFFDNLEQLGTAFYLITMHEEMARVLTSDYNTYASKINMSDGSDRMFKTEPSLKTLQEFWTAHVTQNNEMPNKTTTYKRNLLKGLDDFDQSTSSESSSDEQEIKKPTEKKAKSTHSQMTKKTKIHQNLLLKLKKERGKEK